jgi:hypothetical protein
VFITSPKDGVGITASSLYSSTSIAARVRKNCYLSDGMRSSVTGTNFRAEFRSVIGKLCEKRPQVQAAVVINTH